MTPSRPSITVVAFGLSPRGNDDFEASSNISHSPIRFLEEVGEAYRSSGRTKPIADEVSIHCYPNLNTDAPTIGYAWPKIGCADLDRFKQVWWDAFHGTAQSLFQEAGDAGAPVQWRHTDRIVGGRATFKLPRSFLVRAEEGFSYDVKITRPTSTRRLTNAAGQAEARAMCSSSCRSLSAARTG